MTRYKRDQDMQLVWDERQLTKTDAQTILEALRAARDLFAKGHAIDHFDWGKSFLQAEDIRELNETPGKINAAIRLLEGKQ